MAESGKRICDKCRSERLRLLEEKLQIALFEIDDLTKKNEELEEQLRLVAAGREIGRRDTVQGHLKGGECLVFGDWIIWNVGTECSDMKVECFSGIRMKQLHRVIGNRDLGSPDTVVIHVGTNDLRTGTLDYVIGYVYNLVNMAKTKFSKFIVVLSGMLWRRDVSRWHIGAINSRQEWVAKMLGVTFVHPNSWMED